MSASPLTKAFVIASALALGTPLAAQTAPPTQPPPVKLTTAQDHQRMMDLLHITSLRPGADAYKTDSPNYAIFDEAKVDHNYTYPNALTTFAGKKVTSSNVWWKVRRPEIVAYMDRELYGRVPANVPKVTWEVVSATHETIGDVPMITKKLVGHVDNSNYPAITVNIDLTLSTPANAKGPVPVIMEFAYNFPQRPGAPVPAVVHPTWQEQVVAKGIWPETARVL